MRQKARNILIIYLIISTISVPSYALQSDIMPEGIIRPRFAYINVFQSNFDISSSGRAEAEVFLLAYGVDQVKVEANIQQYRNGSWQTIKNWSNTENGTSSSLRKYLYLTSGYSYRLIAKGYVYVNSITVEDDEIISQIIIY